MLLKQLLILGHPRCGSGFCSYYLNLLGLQIVHEKDPLHHDGISNWAFTIIHNKNDNIYPRYGLNGDLWRNKYEFNKIIVHLRNPFDSMESIINENNIGWSFNIRQLYIKKELNKTILGNDLEKAILCYLYWYEILLSRCDFYFRIEYDLDQLNEYVSSLFDKEITSIDNTKIDKKVNSKLKIKSLTKESYLNVNNDIMYQLNKFCIKYNYPTYEQTFRSI